MIDRFDLEASPSRVMEMRSRLVASRTQTFWATPEPRGEHVCAQQPKVVPLHGSKKTLGTENMGASDRKQIESASPQKPGWLA